MTKYYKISSGKIQECVQAEANVYWVISPDEKERGYYCASYNLDEHTFLSALDTEEPARLEVESDHLAIIFKRPKNYTKDDLLTFKVSSIGFFLFKDKLIIVSTDASFSFEGKVFLNAEHPEDVMLRMIFTIVHHYLDHLRVINQISEEIENRISISMENHHLLDLFGLEKSLVYYLNAINANAFVLDKLKHHFQKNEFSITSREYLDDLSIENSQCFRQAEIYSNILAGLMDARASIVGNNLNILMKRLNLITLVIMVPTLVVSLFSMNVPLPLESYRYAFMIVLTLCVISILCVIVWWKRETALQIRKR